MEPQTTSVSNPQSTAEPEPFRVLSLDGGGILGAFTASVLATFEESTKQRVVDHFDLIAGTSTGGIIAIGLAMGVPAADLLRFYETQGAKIFPPAGRASGWLRSLWSLFRPRFRETGLRKAIEDVIGDQPMRTARTRLVIPAYDVNVGKVYVFKTPHHPNCLAHADLPAIDVALATSAAPTYFPAHSIPRLGTFIDGGLWANSPTIVAMIEAFDFLGRRPDQVRLLSISTTSYPFRLNNPRKMRGILGWAPKILDTFMFGQIQAAENAARCLLRTGVFRRIDFQTLPGELRMDDVHAVADLVAMGCHVASLNAEREAVEQHFLNGRRTPPFNPDV